MIEHSLHDDKITLIKPAETSFIKKETEYIYCTEFLVDNSENADTAQLRSFLSDIGDCSAAIEHSGIIKVHVHTNRPDKVLEKALEIGEISNIKIDNMKIQSEEKNNDSCGMISLCNGEGLKNILEKNLGVTALECPETMNASAGDILEAINKCPYENIFISPNNKNTVLAAQRAAVMSHKKVQVISAKTIPEGIAAARSFKPSLSPEKNVAEAEHSASLVFSGAVTYAARNGNINGKSFLKGDIICLEGDEVIFSEDNPESAALKIIIHLIESRNKSKISLIYGKDIDGYNAEKIVNSVLAQHNNIEIEYYYGGQPLYYYIISAE